MSITQPKGLAGLTTTTPDGPTITQRRTLTTGSVTWAASEFDCGRSFMLVANTADTQWNVHLTADQWAAFQEFVKPVECKACGDSRVSAGPDGFGNYDPCDRCV